MSEYHDGLEATYRDWQDAEIDWNAWFSRNRKALNASIKACADERRQGYYSSLTVEQVLIEAQQQWGGRSDG